MSEELKATITLDIDEKTFRSDLKGFSQRIKQQEAIEISTRLGDMRQTQKELRDQIKELEKAYKIEPDIGKKNIIRDSLIEARSQAEILKKEITSTNAELLNFARTGDREVSVFGAIFGKINKTIEEAGQRLENLDKKEVFKKLQEELNGVNESFKKGDISLENMQKRTAGISALSGEFGQLNEKLKKNGLDTLSDDLKRVEQEFSNGKITVEDFAKKVKDIDKASGSVLELNKRMENVEKRKLGGVQKEVDELNDKLKKGTINAKEYGERIENIKGPKAGGGAVGGFLEGAGVSIPTGAAAVGSGVVAGGALLGKELYDNANALKAMQKALNLTNEELLVYQGYIQKLNEKGFIDNAKNIEQITLARKALNLQGQELVDYVEFLQNFSSTFGQETEKTTDAISKMVKNLGVGTDEAKDLLTGLFQEVPDLSGDALDSIIEYSSGMKDAGITGKEAIQLLIDAQKAGIRNTDEFVDAIREFGIRFNEVGGNKAQKEGLKALGLDYAKLSEDIRSGAITQSDAMKLVSQEIEKIDDNQKKAGISAQIFGTKAEDIGTILTETLSKGGKETDDFTGRFEKLNKTAQQGLDGLVSRSIGGVKSGIIDLSNTAQEAYKSIGDTGEAQAGFTKLGGVLSSTSNGIGMVLDGLVKFGAIASAEIGRKFGEFFLEIPFKITMLQKGFSDFFSSVSINTEAFVDSGKNSFTFFVDYVGIIFSSLGNNISVNFLSILNGIIGGINTVIESANALGASIDTIKPFDTGSLITADDRIKSINEKTNEYSQRQEEINRKQQAKTDAIKKENEILAEQIQIEREKQVFGEKSQQMLQKVRDTQKEIAELGKKVQSESQAGGVSEGTIAELEAMKQKLLGLSKAGDSVEFANIKTKLNELSTTAIQDFSKIRNEAKKNISVNTSGVTAGASNIKRTLGELKNSISSPIREGVKSGESSLSGFASKAFQYAKNIVSSFASGANSQKGLVASAFAGVGQVVKDYIGARSPTKFGPLAVDQATWGKNIVRSFSNGAIGEKDFVADAFGEVAKEARDKLIEGQVKTLEDIAIEKLANAKGNNDEILKINKEFEESKKIVQMSELERIVYFAEKEKEVEEKKNKEIQEKNEAFNKKKEEAIEGYTKAVQEQANIYKKLQDLGMQALEMIGKETQEQDSKIKSHTEEIQKLGKEYEGMRKKASDSIQSIEKEFSRLGENTEDKLVNRAINLKKEQGESEKKILELEGNLASSGDKDREKIEKSITEEKERQIKLIEELALIDSKNISDKIAKQEEFNSLSESEKILLEEKLKMDELSQRKKIQESFLSGELTQQDGKIFAGGEEITNETAISEAQATLKQEMEIKARQDVEKNAIAELEDLKKQSLDREIKAQEILTERFGIEIEKRKTKTQEFLQLLSANNEAQNNISLAKTEIKNIIDGEIKLKLETDSNFQATPDLIKKLEQGLAEKINLKLKGVQ